MSLDNPHSADHRSEHYLLALQLVAETSGALLVEDQATPAFWQKLGDALRTLMSMAMASVAILEDEGQTLRYVASSGVEPSATGTTKLLAEMPTSRRCLEENRTIIINDQRVMDGSQINKAAISIWPIRAILMVPLVIGEEKIGVLSVAHHEPRDFSESDVRLAEAWAGLASVAVMNERLYHRVTESLSSQKRLFAQRDALFAVNEAVSRAKSVDEILQIMADMAPAALNIDMCQVNLAAEPDCFQVAAITQKYAGGIVGTRFPLKNSNNGLVMKNLQVMVINDGPNDPTLHPVLRHKLPSGSVMYAPLIGARANALGVIVLTRELPSVFTPDEVSLTKVFATRAAAAVENARLLEQTRRDADTRQMLLRELNHRVKNNLAGIVSLLQIDQPPMPAAAKRWVNRVVDRVSTLARTHEMFSTADQRLTLRQVVEKTLKSLDVITPAGVRREIDLGDVNLCLQTDRAISVSMVLHELCYNAIVHGLVERGTLLVRGHMKGERELVLEVVDNGRGVGPVMAAPALGNPDGSDVRVRQKVSPDRVSQGTGLGLNLVRDFTARELRGTFSLTETPGGGVTARVEFAALEDEIGIWR